MHGFIRREDLPAVEPWARYWRTWVSAAFLKEYLATAGTARFVPKSAEELQAALDASMLERALHELAFELESRPDRVRIPILGILELIT